MVGDSERIKKPAASLPAGPSPLVCASAMGRSTGFYKGYKMKQRIACWLVACIFACQTVGFSQDIPIKQNLLSVPTADSQDVGDISVVGLAAIKADEAAKASVRLSGCSGIVIAIVGEHAYGLSAAHCSRVNREFQYTNYDGSTGYARWIAEDNKTDLALWKGWAKDVKGSMPVWEELVTSIPDLSRTTGDGKHGRKTLQYRSGVTINRSLSRVRYDVIRGTFAGGDSGGGVTADGGVVGIISHSGGKSVCYTSSHDQIVDFLKGQETCFRLKCLFRRGCCRKPDYIVDKAPPIEPPPPGGDLDSDKDRRDAIADIQRRLVGLEELLKGLEGKPDDSKAVIKVAVSEYIETIKSQLVGVAGKDGSSGKGQDGKPGAAGKDGRDGQAITGKTGLDGLPGKAGTITIVLVSEDGKEISRYTRVESGSVARLKLTKVLLNGE